MAHDHELTLNAFRADVENEKENLRKSSVGSVEYFMTGKGEKEKKKQVGAAKERDELLKKKLENALATGLVWGRKLERGV